MTIVSICLKFIFTIIIIINYYYYAND